jgi:hypothetical protein
MPVYLGNTQVQKIYLGGIEIKNIYLGTVLIYAIATTSVQPTIDAFKTRVRKRWRNFEAEQCLFDLLTTLSNTP